MSRLLSFVATLILADGCQNKDLLTLHEGQNHFLVSCLVAELNLVGLGFYNGTHKNKQTRGTLSNF